MPSFNEDASETDVEADAPLAPTATEGRLPEAADLDTHHDTDKDDTDDGVDLVDPSSFPETPEGLDEFMTAICRIPGTKGTTTAVERPKPMMYQATSMIVEAASMREIPIPVITPTPAALSGSNGTVDGAPAGGEGAIRVDWEASVEDYDIDLTISLFADSNQIVQAEERLAPAAKGSFLIPINNADADDKEREDTSPSGSNNDDDELPMALLLEFDNSYSWITPKTVSYRISMTPPPDRAHRLVVRRATRALKVVTARHQQLLLEKQQYEEQHQQRLDMVKEEQKKRKEEQEMLQRRAAMAHQELVRSKASEVEAHQAAADAAAKATELERRVDAEMAALQDLRKKVRELELERTNRKKRFMEEMMKLRGDSGSIVYGNNHEDESNANDDDDHANEIVNEVLQAANQAVAEAEAETGRAREKVQKWQMEIDETAVQLQEQQQDAAKLQAELDVAAAKAKELIASARFLESQEGALKKLLLL